METEFVRIAIPALLVYGNTARNRGFAQNSALDVDTTNVYSTREITN